MYDNAQLAFITYDSEHHRVVIIGMPGVKPHADGHAGLHHMVFTRANLRDLVHTYERLTTAGITPQFCINHGPTTVRAVVTMRSTCPIYGAGQRWTRSAA